MECDGTVCLCRSISNETDLSRGASLIRDWHLFLYNLIHTSSWKKLLIHHSECLLHYQICNWPLVKSLLDWHERILSHKFFSSILAFICVVFLFFSLPPEDCWMEPAVSILTSLTLKSLLSLDQDADNVPHLKWTAFIIVRVFNDFCHCVKGA